MAGSRTAVVVARYILGVGRQRGEKHEAGKYRGQSRIFLRRNIDVTHPCACPTHQLTHAFRSPECVARVGVVGVPVELHAVTKRFCVFVHVTRVRRTPRVAQWQEFGDVFIPCTAYVAVELHVCVLAARREVLVKETLHPLQSTDNWGVGS